MSDKALSSLEKTNFQKEQLLEKDDLQRLLKNHIEVIAPNVIVISEEFGEWSQGGRKIDLLAIDKDANLVVIELKRTNDGGHMELQAIRYAAMVANMTWDQAKDIFKKYLNKNKIDFNAEEKLCEFLEWDAPKEDDFAQNVRIILASADFSKEITTSVLWLNEHDLDISCVRLSLYKIDSRLILSADQIIPLPEAENYQIAVQQKRREEKISKLSKKDHSLHNISYEGLLYKDNFKKSDIAFFTINLLNEKKLIDKDIFNFLRSDTSCNFKLLKQKDEITENEKKYSKYRYSREPELIFNNIGYYIARNWGVNNIGNFIEKIQNRFPNISYSQTTINDIQ